eukprot:m.2319 g.2319  ORF g.2319 m.2319 type:complete len:443 (+) comp8574_c0_seq2:79-1407(+)
MTLTAKATPLKRQHSIHSLCLSNRFAGSLVGLAAGDALGTAVEFQRPGSFEELTDIIGGGAFRLKPGQWTDDTSMALCLAQSLIECGGYNPYDQMERYWSWFQDGHFSSTGICFDIGNTTSYAIHQFASKGKESHNPYWGGTSVRSAGNGSLMRLAPVPLVFYKHPKQAIAASGDSSKVTHNVKPAIDACRYFGGLLVGCLQGETKEALTSPYYSPFPDDPEFWERPENALVPEIAEIAGGSYLKRDPPEITGAGYVVRTLEAVLWAFYHSETFEEGCLKVANLGDDADTTAAIYGQLAGAFYGLDAIPSGWRKKVMLHSLIERMAEELVSLSEKIEVPQLPEKPGDPAPTATLQSALSEAYQKAMKGFEFLESGIQKIVRKVNKHGKGYETLDEFDKDMADMFDGYNKLTDGHPDENMLESFKTMETFYREQVERRVQYKF